MHRELARPAFEQAPGSRPAPDRACDLHDLLSDETDLLIAADLIVAATGSWAAESALNCWHNRSRPPSACRLWLDRGARLRRARRRDRERRGLPWMSHRADRRTVVQSRGVAGRGRRQSRRASLRAPTTSPRPMLPPRMPKTATSRRHLHRIAPPLSKPHVGIVR